MMKTCQERGLLDSSILGSAWIMLKRNVLLSPDFLGNRGSQGLGDLGNEPRFMCLLIPSVRCAGARAGEQGGSIMECKEHKQVAK